MPEHNLVDFAIITIRSDEFEAVLQRFPPHSTLVKRRQYNLSKVATISGGAYTVAVVRCVEQGIGEAQDLTRDLLDDLAPRWVIVAGIAGGVPSEDFSLGDVIVSTRIYDFTVESISAGKPPSFSSTGGSLHKAAASAVANIPALRLPRGWNSSRSIGLERPLVDPATAEIYAEGQWADALRRSLRSHFGERPRRPVVRAGPIASSDRLLKDPEYISPWLQVARHIAAFEMESAGVYRAARGMTPEVPFLAIRGISDIIGLARDDRWTKYACSSAAAFLHAFLHAAPVPHVDVRGPSIGHRDMGAPAHILLILPDSGQSRIYRFSLEAAGYSITTESDLSRAVESIQRVRPDAVVVHEGVSTTRGALPELRRHLRPRVPILRIKLGAQPALQPAAPEIQEILRRLRRLGLARDADRAPSGAL
jgi:nucleoside phosphorylase